MPQLRTRIVAVGVLHPFIIKCVLRYTPNLGLNTAPTVFKEPVRSSMQERDNLTHSVATLLE